MSDHRNHLFAVLTVIISSTVALLAAEAVLRWQRAQTSTSGHMNPGLLHYHPRLGWALSANWQGQHQHQDYLAQYRISAQGWRNTPDRKDNQAWQTRHVWIGDSFTFGLGVNDADTFSNQLNRLQTDEQHYNLGVPGYSTDQQLLALDKGLIGIKPDRVSVVVYLANDIIDNSLNYPLQAEQAKPYYQLNGGKLDLHNVPVPRVTKPAALQNQSLSSWLAPALGQKAPWWQHIELLRRTLGQPALPAGLDKRLEQRLREPLTLFNALHDRMQEQAKQHSWQLDWVLLPGRSAVLFPESLSGRYQRFLRRQLIAHDPRMLDLLPLYRAAEDPAALYFPNDGHLTPLGHSFTADILGKL